MTFVELIQVNESHLMSIVTQPWQNNYVYASNFSVLPRVRNLVLDKACRVLVTAGSTVSTTTRLPTTSTTSMLSTTTVDRMGGRTIPDVDGEDFSNLFLTSVSFRIHI